MYISGLELQGFKSFAYKTEIQFDRGITAIVGPNGCGKSNIVDSLRWVLGEQRPTHLRSSSMSNIIFNGTAQKNALGMAEVSLTFVNNKGLLPTEYSEVTIGRRLYRSGESEYLINGTTCRLKDIMELFMDTGMSADAYSVIELNMVEEILTNKNNDRRRLFEEAAGVTSYKEKRKKTLRKLDSTQEDLQRVEDLVVEIRKKVRSLERQAEKARKAQKYQKELTHLDKALNRHKYENIQEELEPLKDRIQNAEKEKKEILSKIEKLEDAEEKARAALKEREQNEAEAQRRVSLLTSTVRETETELQITREKISTEKNVIKQYTDDIDQAERDLKELRELFERTEKKLNDFNTELAKAKENLDESKSTYSSIQQQYAQKRKALDELEKEHRNASDELNKLETRRIKIESRLENTDEEINRIDTERSNLKEEIRQLREKKDNLSQEIEEARKIRKQKEEALQQAREKREQLGRQQNELKDNIRKYQSRYDSLQSEISLLREIAQSNEAFPTSVKYLLENHAGDFELLEVVSNLLSTDEEHAVALEAALGSALNFLVVQSVEDARRAAQILREKEKGQATFIPLDQLASHYETRTNALAHIVETPKKFSAINELLLGEVVMYESLEKGFEKRDEHTVAVTTNGEVITNRQFLRSGSTGKNAGMRVGLKDKIEKLEEKSSAVTQKINEAQEKLQSLQASHREIDLQALEKALNKSQKNVRKKEDLFNSYKSKIPVHQANIKELEHRAESLADNKNSSGDALEKLKPKKKKLTKKLEDLAEKEKQKESEINDLEEERSIAQNRFNDARLKHQNLKNEVENHERDIRRAEDGIKNLKKRLKERSTKKSEAKDRIKKYKSRINELEEKLSTAKKKKKEADAQLETAKEASAKQRGKINEVENDLKEVRRQKEVNMELVHHLSMAREKFDMQANNISDHIWDTYEMLMDQVEVTLPEDKEPDEAKERISWLRQKLNRIGEVNALAVEEFEEEKERLDFYEDQIADLTKAREELEETIAEINKTATERFNKTFEKIRSNFQDVFHTLFNEEDFCDLIIDEEAEDPLEASIDIEANPRGKRPSTITQLSTGEKTLTAIALLFAIYLVKPSPFCVLDEVDAPLDDANIERFANMLKRFSQETQFIIITHNKKTMSKAEMMYGVTMPETGISRLVGVKMDEVMQA
ncbi:MAG TPA: chromosome segregation protein SMC [Balneolaceae bacterium]|nr:chromosome segregation protein SMC [Balneolaceae bacterium]